MGSVGGLGLRRFVDFHGIFVVSSNIFFSEFWLGALWPLVMMTFVGFLVIIPGTLE